MINDVVEKAILLLINGDDQKQRNLQSPYAVLKPKLQICSVLTSEIIDYLPPFLCCNKTSSSSGKEKGLTFANKNLKDPMCNIILKEFRDTGVIL